MQLASLARFPHTRKAAGNRGERQAELVQEYIASPGCLTGLVNFEGNAPLRREALRRASRHSGICMVLCATGEIPVWTGIGVRPEARCVWHKLCRARWRRRRWRWGGRSHGPQSEEAHAMPGDFHRCLVDDRRGRYVCLRPQIAGTVRRVHRYRHTHVSNEPEQHGD
jgi:hypothetical protein